MSLVARARTILSQRESILWIAVLAIVATVQWPMLKGLYYRTAGSTAPAGRIEWRTDLEAALAEARRTNRPILVDFYAGWCPPCITMKHDVWPDRRVARVVTAGYIPLMIDVDRDEQTAARYEVSAIPTILVLDPGGRVVRSAGYLPVSGLLRFLQ